MSSSSTRSMSKVKVSISLADGTEEILKISAPAQGFSVRLEDVRDRLPPNTTLKWEDEDGDLVTIKTKEDWRVAKESAAAGSVLKLRAFEGVLQPHAGRVAAGRIQASPLRTATRPQAHHLPQAQHLHAAAAAAAATAPICGGGGGGSAASADETAPLQPLTGSSQRNMFKDPTHPPATAVFTHEQWMDVKDQFFQVGKWYEGANNIAEGHLYHNAAGAMNKGQEIYGSEITSLGNHCGRLFTESVMSILVGNTGLKVGGWPPKAQPGKICKFAGGEAGYMPKQHLVDDLTQLNHYGNRVNHTTMKNLRPDEKPDVVARVFRVAKHVLDSFYQQNGGPRGAVARRIQSAVLQQRRPQQQQPYRPQQQQPYRPPQQPYRPQQQPRTQPPRTQQPRTQQPRTLPPRTQPPRTQPPRHQQRSRVDLDAARSLAEFIRLQPSGTTTGCDRVPFLVVKELASFYAQHPAHKVVVQGNLKPFCAMFSHMFKFDEFEPHSESRIHVLGIGSTAPVHRPQRPPAARASSAAGPQEAWCVVGAPVMYTDRSTSVKHLVTITAVEPPLPNEMLTDITITFANGQQRQTSADRVVPAAPPRPHVPQQPQQRCSPFGHSGQQARGAAEELATWVQSQGGSVKAVAMKPFYDTHSAEVGDVVKRAKPMQLCTDFPDILRFVKEHNPAESMIHSVAVRGARTPPQRRPVAASAAQSRPRAPPSRADDLTFDQLLDELLSPPPQRRSATASTAPGSRPQASWQCRACTLINDTGTKCSLCNTAK